MSAATSLGNELRQERLRKGLDLAGIAKETRIRTAILEAIEEDRFDCIPGGAYRYHFLRQYARALGIDGDAIVAEFKEEHEDLPVPLPIPPKTRRSRIWADLAWAIVVIASLVAAYKLTEIRRSATKQQDQALAQMLHVERPAQIAPPQEAPAPPPPNAPSPGQAPVHVAFTATEPVWVSVKCDGNASYAGVLEVPQSKTFDAAGAVTVLIGNAGGLQISLNGKPLGALGAHGEVEMIELTLQGAHRISRPPNVAASDPQL
jgi:transcriptional regulator with XRE-family HTH domain